MLSAASGVHPIAVPALILKRELVRAPPAVRVLARPGASIRSSGACSCRTRGRGAGVGDRCDAGPGREGGAVVVAGWSGGSRRIARCEAGACLAPGGTFSGSAGWSAGCLVEWSAGAWRRGLRGAALVEGSLVLMRWRSGLDWPAYGRAPFVVQGLTAAIALCRSARNSAMEIARVERDDPADGTTTRSVSLARGR